MSGPIPTAVWIATQAVPSAEVAVDHGTAYFGMRWQVTPVLYSFGVNRKVSPWRFLVVDPFARVSGSIETFLDPEFIAVPGHFEDQWSIRGGARVYFPLVTHGENLAMSLGTSLSSMHTREVGYEAGVYVLYGFLGGVVTYSPTPEATRWIFTLNVKVF
ncbi:MAG TPA: hypothetical protein VF407_23590 [Polyangiaceae bacterium]